MEDNIRDTTVAKIEVHLHFPRRKGGAYKYMLLLVALIEICVAFQEYAFNKLTNLTTQCQLVSCSNSYRSYRVPLVQP